MNPLSLFNQLGSVSVSVVQPVCSGWMVFEVTAAGFGSGDMFFHWGVGKQSLGSRFVRLLYAYCNILYHIMYNVYQQLHNILTDIATYVLETINVSFHRVICCCSLFGMSDYPTFDLFVAESNSARCPSKLLAEDSRRMDCSCGDSSTNHSTSRSCTRLKQLLFWFDMSIQQLTTLGDFHSNGTWVRVNLLCRLYMAYWINLYTLLILVDTFWLNPHVCQVS